MAFVMLFWGKHLSLRKRFFYILCSFSIAVLLATVLGIIHNNFLPSFLRQVFHRPAKKYAHLRPLREMFANASKATYTRQSSKHERTWQTKATPMFQLSDLQEVDNKKSVLLLVIVTTAPSRKERRKAIRATWWKKCDGIEVSFKVLVNRSAAGSSVNKSKQSWIHLKRMPILIIQENLISWPWNLQINVARGHEISNKRYCVLPRIISNTKDPV